MDAVRDFAADLALCDAATPGPWEVRPEGGHRDPSSAPPRCVARPRPDLAERFPPHSCGDALREEQVVGAWAAKRADLEFIAAAREGWPAAIRRVRELEAICYALIDAYDNGTMGVHDVVVMAREVMR